MEKNFLIQLRIGHLLTLKNEKIASNFLTIPRGGQFSLNLEDGTKVLLNSDSKI
jgi:ferric-dicitrate binding protein FerR (iron transport regulator)